MDLGEGRSQRLAAVALVMAVAAGCTGQGEGAGGGNGEDLLRNHDWTQMPGTTARNGILRVSALIGTSWSRTPPAASPTPAEPGKPASQLRWRLHGHRTHVRCG